LLPIPSLLAPCWHLREPGYGKIRKKKRLYHIFLSTGSQKIKWISLNKSAKKENPFIFLDTGHCFYS